MSTNTEIKYWIGLSKVSGIGTARFSLLEQHFGNPEAAWKAPAGELAKAGLDSKTVAELLEQRAQVNLDEELEKLERHRVKALTWHDASYPARLKEVYDRPPVLYVEGSFLPEDEWCLAVVGTRRATIYGRQVTEEIVSHLARNRITIISGLARGIDSVAHRSTLEAGGRTMAVFACGLDIVYPAENRKLASDIVEHGALISEYPLGTKPMAQHFPRRNRIMSGISLGVLVIEAGERSGALNTVSHALEQNREVFAIPGSILSPASRGANTIIQQGAKLVTNGNDILEELNLTGVAQQLEMKTVLPENDVEASLLKELTSEPLHVDEVCRRSGLHIAVVSSTLALMELKGMTRQVGGMNYVLAREAREDYRVKVE
ncbi:MAG: processing protein [Dehalococcoidia bacterium]|nr:processing protein [Dehalococcoidia bacterium]